MNSEIGFQAPGCVRCNLKMKNRSQKTIGTTKGAVFSRRLTGDCKEAVKDKARGTNGSRSDI